MTSQSTLDGQPSHNVFVGRERELAELRAGLDDVGAGHGRMFLLSGEPGIGKTRLAEEISNDASARGMRVVWGRCWEGGGAPAYWPFIQILRACVEGLDVEHLKALLGSGASEIARLIPELKLSLPSLEEAKTGTDSESSRFLLFDSVATLLKNVARGGPLVIVLDDLHDADQPSLQMLRFIARAAKDVSLLMIGTYRDAEVRQSPELGKMIGDLIREGRTVSVGGLSQAEVGEFIERRSAKKADDKLVTDLYHATDGNPLFVDGVVRLLAAEGKLERTGFDGSAVKIPHGVRESIRRQLAALSDEANALLSIASVIGNEFDTRLLERVSGRSPEQIVEQTDEAVRIGVLRLGAPGFARQQFSHALIREVLYEDLAANRRIALHCEIGAAIEEIYKSDLKPQWAQLAHHYRAAHVAGKAIDYSIDAGEAAYRIFAYEDAILHWTAAEQLTEKLPEPNERRARLLERLGDALVLTGADQWTALQYLESALHAYESLNRPERAARVHSRLGIALSYQGRPTCDLRGALSHYRAAESILSGSPDTTSLGLLHIGLAVTAGGLARYEEGLADSGRAMEIARRLGNDPMWVYAAIQRSYCLFFRGHLRESFELCRRAWEEADRLKDSLARSTAARIGAGCCNFLWDPIEGKRWAKLALDRPRSNLAIAERDALLWQVVIAQTNLGDMKGAREVATKLSDQPTQVGRYLEAFERGLNFFEGRWETFEHSQIESMDVARRSGDRYEELGCLNLLGRVRRYAGKLKQAEDALREFLTLSPANPTQEMLARPELAIVRSGLGRPEEALPHLQRCREIMAAGEDWRGIAGLVDLAESVVACADGSHGDAQQGFRRSFEVFNHYDLPYLQADTLYYWGQALASAGERDQSEAKFESAIDIYRRHGAGQRWIDRVMAERTLTVESLTSAAPKENHGSAEDSIFHREGDYWTVAYDGRTSRLKDAKGLHYIAYLLGHPSQEIRALDLVTRIGGGGEEASDKAGAEDLARSDSVAGDLGHAGEMLDAQAKAAYQRRLTELEDELEEARELGNEARAEKAEDEIEALGRELRGAIGLAGRDRRAASSTERARIAVTKAIRLSLNKIAENDASLGKLLSTTIKTGTVCAYVPDDRFPVTWRL